MRIVEPPRRRPVRSALVLSLLCGLIVAPAAHALAGTRTQLSRARRSLLAAERAIRSEQVRLQAIQHRESVTLKRLRALQGSLNALSAKGEAAQNRYSSLRQQVLDTQVGIAQDERSYARLHRRLDDWARISYEQGPASELGILLRSTSLSDLSDRIEFVNRMSQVTGDLADQVQNRANQMKERRAELQV